MSDAIRANATANAGWAADGPDSRRVLFIVLAACAILPAGFIARLLIFPDVLFPDFFGLWSFGRFVLTHKPAAIYDFAALHGFQAGFGMPAGDSFPFPYPPWILLLLAPVAALPYLAARIVWLVASFAGYAASVGAWRWPRLPVALLIVAPSSAVCFLVGQNGFLSAALLLGGVRLLSVRPLVAGAMLAATAYKPQLAVLVPFLLVFGGHWRALVAACVTAVALSLAAALAFGPSIWGAWLAAMHDQAPTLAAGREASRDMMPTVTSAVLLLGGGVFLAHLVQAVGAAAGILALWRVRARDDAEARAVLPLATMLATPYAYHYDLPMVTGAVLAVIAARIAASGRFGGGEFPLLLACVAAPAILPGHVGAASAVLPVIFALTVWKLARPRGSLVQPALPSRHAPA